MSIKISEKEDSIKKRKKINSEIDKENIMMNGTLKSHSFSSKKIRQVQKDKMILKDINLVKNDSIKNQNDDYA